MSNQNPSTGTAKAVSNSSGTRTRITRGIRTRTPRGYLIPQAITQISLWKIDGILLETGSRRTDYTYKDLRPHFLFSAFFVIVVVVSNRFGYL